MQYPSEGRPFDDGQSIVYVNGQWRGNDDIGRLMHDMKQVDPAKMLGSVLSNRMKMFKEVDKEGKPMSELSKKLIDLIREEVDEEALKKERREGLSQGLTRTARAMLREGIPLDTIARCTSLPVEEIERMKAEPAT